MELPSYRLWHLLCSIISFAIGIALLLFTYFSTIYGGSDSSWSIYGDPSWRTWIGFFDNLYIIAFLSPLVFLLGLRLFGLKTPKPLLYSVFTLGFFIIAQVTFGLFGLLNEGTASNSWAIILYVILTFLFGIVYPLQEMHAASKYKQNAIWFIAALTIWSLFALPWQRVGYALLSPAQQHLMEDVVFGPSVEAARESIRRCQPFVSRYGQLRSLKLIDGFAFYDAEKEEMDPRNYTFFFDAERGKERIRINPSPSSSGFSIGMKSFCGGGY